MREKASVDRLIMIKNYHTQSMKWEASYATYLLEKYGYLLLLLNDVRKLNKSTIDTAIQEWKAEYWDEIVETNIKYMKKLDTFSNKIVESDKTDRQQEAQQAKLASDNNKMLDITTEYIRQRFTELGILESGHNYSPDKATLFLKQIASNVQDKLNLFATMSMVSNLNTLLVTNAMSDGWEEAQWRTQRDSKVRATHAAMDNKWCRLDDPSPQPAGCQVGIDYNCRCYWINFRKRGIDGRWIYKYPLAA